MSSNSTDRSVNIGCFLHPCTQVSSASEYWLIIIQLLKLKELRWNIHTAIEQDMNLQPRWYVFSRMSFNSADISTINKQNGMFVLTQFMRPSKEALY